MLAVLAVAFALVADPPRPTGFVNDLANVLSASERTALESRLRAWKTSSGHELAVLTMQDLGGEEIEPFANRVARAWKIGSAEKSDGALLVVAMKERKVRIEVLVGLEGDLPDALCGRIIDREIVPRFKSKDFAGGVRAGVEAILAAAGGAPPPSVAEHRAAKRKSSGAPFAIFPILLFIFIAAARRNSRGTSGPFGRTRRLGGMGPMSTWAGLAMLDSMTRGGSKPGGGFFGGGGGGGGGGSFGGFGGGGRSFGGGASGGW